MPSTEDRDTAREVFFRAWRHHRENSALEGVERVLVAVALRHPALCARESEARARSTR